VGKRVKNVDILTVDDRIDIIEPHLGVVMMIDYCSLRLVEDLTKEGNLSLYKPLLDMGKLVTVIPVSTIKAGYEREA